MVMRSIHAKSLSFSVNGSWMGKWGLGLSGPYICCDSASSLLSSSVAPPLPPSPPHPPFFCLLPPLPPPPCLGAGGMSSSISCRYAPPPEAPPAPTDPVVRSPRAPPVPPPPPPKLPNSRFPSAAPKEGSAPARISTSPPGAPPPSSLCGALGRSIWRRFRVKPTLDALAATSSDVNASMPPIPAALNELKDKSPDPCCTASTKLIICC
mmetsp:Transcript_13073/g.31695  ORF Transcript_13073/g.31695 Transcript_13073/m.31695 type:complete len:209 (-) Transcript_13073:381-1007(-)